MKNILGILVILSMFCNPVSAEEAGWSELENGSLISDNVILDDDHIAHTLIKVKSGNYSVVYAVRLDFIKNLAIVDTIYEYVDDALINVIQKPKDTPWHKAVAPNEKEVMKHLRENAYKI